MRKELLAKYLVAKDTDRFTANEAAALLGLSRGTLDRYQKSKELRAAFVKKGDDGRKYREYTRAQLEDYARRNLMPPILAQTVYYIDTAANIAVMSDGRIESLSKLMQK